MDQTHISPQGSRIMEEQLCEEITRIQHAQYEIDEIHEKLDLAVKAAKKQTFPKGEVVAFEKLAEVKQIVDELALKEAENKIAVEKLYQSIFSGEFFIDQSYFETWVCIRPNTVVRFSIDLDRIEVKRMEELN
jgi:hypothetical protein